MQRTYFHLKVEEDKEMAEEAEKEIEANTVKL